MREATVDTLKRSREKPSSRMINETLLVFRLLLRLCFKIFRYIRLYLKRSVRFLKSSIRTKAFLSTACMIAAVFLCFGILKATFHPVLVIGSSMEPTYVSGDILTSETDFDTDDITYGTVVIFEADDPINKTVIKRVVGLPGDTLLIQNGELYVNGKFFDRESYGMDGSLIYDAGLLAKEITLGEGEYFCMGDNVNNSSDCRKCGSITEISAIITGRVEFIKAGE